MCYRQLGYRKLSRSRTLIPAAIRTLNFLKTQAVLEGGVAQAYTDAGWKDTRKIDTITDWTLSELANAPLFKSNGVALKDFQYITAVMLAQAGRPELSIPETLEYVTDPVMTIDEIIDDVLDDLIHLPDPTSFGGSEAFMMEFRAAVTPILGQIAIVQKQRMYYLDKFQRYMGNLLAQLRDGTLQPASIKGHDKAWLAHYVYDPTNPKAYTRIPTGTPQRLVFPVARDEDPLITKAIMQIKAKCEPGPWTNYTKFWTNGDPMALAYMLAPVLPSLSMITTFERPVHSYSVLMMEVQDTMEWGMDTQRDQFVENIVHSDAAESFLTTAYRLPVYDDTLNLSPVVFDSPMVELSILDVNEQAELTAAWDSKVFRRRITDSTGGNDRVLLQEMALSKDVGDSKKGTSNGALTVEHPDINAWHEKVVDLTRIQGRKMAGSVDGSVTAASTAQRVLEKVYFMKGGKLQAAKVELTQKFHIKGETLWKPAFIEYFRPGRAWFHKPVDASLVDFIMARLGLNYEDRFLSKELIAVSHNLALYNRYVNSGEPAGFDIRRYLEAKTHKSLDPVTDQNPPIV